MANNGILLVFTYNSHVSGTWVVYQIVEDSQVDINKKQFVNQLFLFETYFGGF